MATDGIGLYIHIPFCKRKCNYCDFPSFQGISQTEKKKYVDALISEINSYSRPEKIKVNTVFIGGGTPSLLGGEEMGRVLSSVYESFEISEDAEISMEANPGTLTLENAIAYRSSGINRISIGSQSFCENELKKLGRIHNSGAISEAVAIAREAGFSNINLDLMYGIPEQTMDSFKRSLDSLIALSPEHVSVYGLIIEEGTPFFRGLAELRLPTEDAECDMYYLAAQLLSDNGYRHYEISNYAKEGYECRHNLKYWRDEEYIGVGLAAHSYFGKKRYSNPVTLDEYFSFERERYISTEDIDREANAYEYVMMHLRLSEGFSLSEYKERFGTAFTDGREETLSRFIELGYLMLTDGRISLTERGFYVSNAILTELI